MFRNKGILFSCSVSVLCGHATFVVKAKYVFVREKCRKFFREDFALVTDFVSLRKWESNLKLFWGANVSYCVVVL